MKIISFPVFLLVLLIVWGCQQKLPLNQLKNWQIVVSEEAIPAEKFAAKEFQTLFHSLTGNKLSLSNTSSTEKKNIFIGYSPKYMENSFSPEQNDYGEEGFQIQISPERIIIVGGRPRGTLYGVYEFFERYCGVRYLTADHTYFPSSVNKIELPIKSYSYKPVFVFRWPYYGEVKQNPRFAARLRINTVTNKDSLGGITAQRLINHSFYRQIPVEKYGKQHPEYFALINNKRVLDYWGGGPQPCVSNPQVMDIVTEAVLKEIKEHPQYANYSVSQNDNDAYCRCDSCEAINQREGSPMGAHLHFVNEIARRIKKIYPDKKIGTLSYWYTRKPPRYLKPADNVQIQLADIEDCRLHAVNDPNCQINQVFLDDLTAWSQKTDQLFIWTYMTDFRYYDLPFPNLKAIGPTFKFYAEHGVKGVFAQAHGGSTSGDLSDLRVYVIARCLWNPERDSWQEAKEFCRLHYGRAAPAVIQYLEFIHNNAEQKGIHPACFATPRQLGLDRKVALQLLSIFQKALQLADNDTIRARVAKISLSAWRTLLEAGAEFKVENKRLKRVYPEPYQNAVGTYINLAEKYQLTMPDERTHWTDFKKILQEQYQRGMPVSILENENWRILIDPETGRLIELLYKPRQINFLLAYEANMRYGMLEEWFGEKMDVKQFAGPYQLKEDPQGIQLQRGLKNGGIYLRTIQFDDEHPDRILFRTTFRHTATKPAHYQIVVHPEFNVHSKSNDFKTVGAYVWQDGQWLAYNRNLRQDNGPDTGLLLSAVPGSRHAFFNHAKKFGLIENYQAEKVEKLRTWWVPEQQQLNLEIQTKPVLLHKNESWTFEYQIQFWPEFE